MDARTPLRPLSLILVGVAGVAWRCPTEEAPAESPAPVAAEGVSEEGDDVLLAEPVPVDLSVEYYPVRGDGPPALRAYLDEHGPKDDAGETWDAITDWEVTWTYPYVRYPEGCVTGPVDVRVRCRQVYPRWERPEGASAHVVLDWDRYMQSLREHEAGHRKNAIRAGAAIRARLEALLPKPDCEALEEEADRRAKGIVEAYHGKDAEYDMRTDHGVKQGAVYPPR